MSTGPGAEFDLGGEDDEAPADRGPSRDVLRRMWRPLREVVVSGCRVQLPQSSEPMEVRFGRYLDADERRELFLVCQDRDIPERPWMLLIYPHALDSERNLVVLVDLLKAPGRLGSASEAWRVIRACEAAMGLEREEWVEEKYLADTEARKVLAERTERLRELQAADEAKGLLPEKATPPEPPRKDRKERRRRPR